MSETIIGVGVFIIMAVGWWYDHHLLMADKRDLQRIAHKLLDEITRLRVKYNDEGRDLVVALCSP